MIIAEEEGSEKHRERVEEAIERFRLEERYELVID